MRRVWFLGVTLALVGLSAAAPLRSRATETPGYPTSYERETLLAWLRNQTDIAPGQVISISGGSLTAVVSTFSVSKPRGFRVALRSEAIDPQVSLRSGSLSWHATVQIDCAARKVRLGETTGYAERNLLGASKVIRPADEAWVAPSRGAALDNVYRALCEKGFRRPLTGAPKATKNVDEPPPAPRPITHTAARPRAPSPAAPETRREPKAAPWAGYAQVVASATPAGAQEALRVAKGRVPTGELRTEVIRASVGGKTYYRGVFLGFGSEGQAQRFCQALQAQSQPCFVRRR